MLHVLAAILCLAGAANIDMLRDNLDEDEVPLDACEDDDPDDAPVQADRPRLHEYDEANLDMPPDASFFDDGEDLDPTTSGKIASLVRSRTRWGRSGLSAGLDGLTTSGKRTLGATVTTSHVGARIKYTFDPRMRLGLDTRIRPDKAGIHPSARLSGTWGLRACDAKVTLGGPASPVLGYAVAASCSPFSGLRSSLRWRDGLLTRGGIFVARRAFGAVNRWHAPTWELGTRVNYSPSPTFLSQATWMLQQQGRLTLTERHALSGSVSAWRGRRSLWNHRLRLGWRLGGRRGWAMAVAAIYQGRPPQHSQACFFADGDARWRSDHWSLGAEGRFGLDAMAWRAGVAATWRSFDGVAVSLHTRVGTNAVGKPLKRTALVTAQVQF